MTADWFAALERAFRRDPDNWQPIGILAALDHADTNTTASMLPDWASQQRPE